MYDDFLKFPLRNWVQKQLSDLLKFDVPLELVGVVLSKNTNEDLDQYLKGLLDFNDRRTHEFIREMIAKKGDAHLGSKYDKKFQSVDTKGGPSDDQKKFGDGTVFDKKKHGSKSKTKFTPLSMKPGKVWLEPGRHYCACEAQFHKLINNCLSCGRIVCEQEGSGPCLFCNSLVCSKEEEEIINKGTSESSTLYENLLLQKPPREEFKEQTEKLKALENLQKTRENDANSAQRTKVVDGDQYYAWTNVWLTEEQRAERKRLDEEERHKRQKSKYMKKVTLDMKDLTVNEIYYDDDEKSDNEKQDNVKIETKPEDAVELTGLSVEDSAGTSGTEECAGDASAKSTYVQRIYTKTADRISVKYQKASKNLYNDLNSDDLNLEDILNDLDTEDHQERGDAEHCLSIKQPYTSLVLNGIKKHEGRMWYTSYRGKLWIASSVKKPTEQEISYAMSFYRTLTGAPTDDKLHFPTKFPTGFLLGSVELVDCLPQEEYRSRYPNGEMEDPYVLIFEDAKVLPMQIAVTGKSFIFTLSPYVCKLINTAESNEDQFLMLRGRSR